MNIFDCIIIGEGPSGMSGALYLKRFGRNIIVLSKNQGGQLVSCGKVDNYLGYFDLTGVELYKKFDEHLNYLNIQRKYVSVEKIEKQFDTFFCYLDNKEIIQSKTILVSSGNNYKKLNIKGEKYLSNKGVSYCTICDAFFFQDQDVAIIGGGNSALDSALILINIARKIYIINKNNYFKNCDFSMFNKIKNSDKIEIIYNANTLEFKGENELESILYEKDKKILEINVSGAFINIGQVPNSIFLHKNILNNFKEIKIKSNNETSISGLFASGDVTENSKHQIIIASGDGAKAAIHINEYLKTYQ